MLSHVYSVYDLKAEAFSPQPFFAVTDGVAKRIFQEALLGDNAIARHPEDYVLFRVGVWNSETGALAGTEAPVQLWTGMEAAKANKGVA